MTDVGLVGWLLRDVKRLYTVLIRSNRKVSARGAGRLYDHPDARLAPTCEYSQPSLYAQQPGVEVLAELN